MGGVHVQLYIVCLVVQPGLLHHAAINDPADRVRQVLGSIHQREAAHEGGVLSAAGQHHLGVLWQNWVAVACEEFSEGIYILFYFNDVILCKRFLREFTIYITDVIETYLLRLYFNVFIVCEISDGNLNNVLACEIQ